MMFNISIDGASFSKNLEDFDSIRSVLLYRSVQLTNGARLLLGYCSACVLYIFKQFAHSCVRYLSTGTWLKFAGCRRGFKNLVQVCKGWGWSSGLQNKNAE